MENDPYLGGRRRHARIRFIREAIPVAVEQGGQFSRHLMSSRDLSAGGMGLIFAGPLAAGTPLRITLPQRGVATELAATVRHCSAITPEAHLLGVQFQRPINPQDFVGEFGDERVNQRADSPP